MHLVLIQHNQRTGRGVYVTLRLVVVYLQVFPPLIQPSAITLSAGCGAGGVTAQ